MLLNGSFNNMYHDLVGCGDMLFERTLVTSSYELKIIQII